MRKRLVWIILLVALAGTMPLRAQGDQGCALDLTQSYLSALSWANPEGIDGLTYARLAGELYNGFIAAGAYCYSLSASVIRTGINQIEPLPEPDALIRTYQRLDESIRYSYSKCPLDITEAYLKAVDWSGLTLDAVADAVLSALQAAEQLVEKDDVLCVDEPRLAFTYSVLSSARSLAPDAGLIPALMEAAGTLTAYSTADCASRVMTTFVREADWTGISAEQFSQTAVQVYAYLAEVLPPSTELYYCSGGPLVTLLTDTLEDAATIPPDAAFVRQITAALRSSGS